MTNSPPASAKWLKTAPRYLIDAYESGRIGKGRPLLAKLLRDKRMGTTWTELTRHIKRDEQWGIVWASICSAKGESNAARLKHITRKDKRDKYRSVASRIKKLSKEVDTWRLNVPGYDLFPQEVFVALGVPQLHEMHPLERDTEAHKVLATWPYTLELLSGLEKCALIKAGEAMTEPRPDVQQAGNRAARVFVCRLGKDFQYHFGLKLLGSIATITNVAFDADEKFSKSFVQGVLKGV